MPRNTSASTHGHAVESIIEHVPPATTMKRPRLEGTDAGRGTADGDTPAAKRPRRQTSLATAKNVARQSKSGVQDKVNSMVSKRPRRRASIAASQKLSRQCKSDSLEEREDKQDDEFRLTRDACDNEDGDDDLSHSCKMDGLLTEFRGTSDLPLPVVTTKLWSHQAKSMETIVDGVKKGKKGHADASAVGAGKTLTALATIVHLATWLQETGRSRHGVLVMLPTKALIREWLLEIAAHTKHFHVIEQREDGTLFSLTYSKTHPPIDGNALIITTLDRVCRHPFIRQVAWDFVVIDECLSVQNADAKRVPSAWRQIEIATCGVLMLSATFFRSKYDS